jgi:hypothetical protein
VEWTKERLIEVAQTQRHGARLTLRQALAAPRGWRGSMLPVPLVASGKPCIETSSTI